MFKQSYIEFKSKFGKTTFCNNKPERAPHIGGFCFPICWRCLSLYLGATVAYLITSKYEFVPSMKLILISIIGILPTVVDGVMQYYFGIESTNARRIITGLISGAFLELLCCMILKLI